MGLGNQAKAGLGHKQVQGPTTVPSRIPTPLTSTYLARNNLARVRAEAPASPSHLELGMAEERGGMGNNTTNSTTTLPPKHQTTSHRLLGCLGSVGMSVGGVGNPVVQVGVGSRTAQLGNHN